MTCQKQKHMCQFVHFNVPRLSLSILTIPIDSATVDCLNISLVSCVLFLETKVLIKFEYKGQ